MFTGVRHASYRDARGLAHSYFFSWEHAPTSTLEVDWLDARNICRRHCMDAVSLETPQENEFVKQRIARGKNHNFCDCFSNTLLIVYSNLKTTHSYINIFGSAPKLQLNFHYLNFTLNKPTGITAFL